MPRAGGKISQDWGPGRSGSRRTAEETVRRALDLFAATDDEAI
jgi:hypothetical protein